MIKAIVFDAYGTLFDVQSVSEEVEKNFPGQGEYITRIWRLKQLEYSWLRTAMGCFLDFRSITRESLVYTLATLGTPINDMQTGRLVGAYDALLPYPDAIGALKRLAGHRLAVLSNGSADMLAALLRRSDLGRHFEAVISVEASRAYKPDHRVYELVEKRLGVPPAEVAFVSSNGFDVAGAKAAGFRVVRVERVTPAALARDIAAAGPIGPALLFEALRSQIEAFGQPADLTVSCLGDLPRRLSELEVLQPR